MEAALVFGIIKTALGIAEDMTSGTKAGDEIATGDAFVDLARQVFDAHKAATGQPMDLTQFHDHPHID